MALMGYFNRPRLILKHDQSQPANLKMEALSVPNALISSLICTGQSLKEFQDKANHTDFEPEVSE